MRDPLDELIEDLERSLPAQTGGFVNDMPSIDDFQTYLTASEASTDAWRRHLKTEPGYRRVQQWFEKRAAQRKTAQSEQASRLASRASSPGESEPVTAATPTRTASTRRLALPQTNRSDTSRSASQDVLVRAK